MLIYRRQDRFHHAVDVLEHIIVPETQDAVALGLKISGLFRIAHNVIRLIVLRAVNLDDKALFMTGEVSEEPTNSGLPAEMRVLDWQMTQMPPEFALPSVMSRRSLRARGTRRSNFSS